MTMMYVMHHGFRRDLAAFAAGVPRTPVADAAPGGRCCAAGRPSRRCCTTTTTSEDTWLWPFLLERADAAERETLRAMEAEHEEIDPLLDRLRNRAARPRRGPGTTATSAPPSPCALTAARESLGRHLAHEERDAMPVLQRHVTAEEWAAIEAHFVEGIRPRLLLALVPWALHEVPAEERRRVLARAGRRWRAVWRLTRHRFARADRAAFDRVAR